MISKRLTSLAILGIALVLLMVGFSFAGNQPIALMSAAQITPANSQTVLPPTSTITLTPSITPTPSLTPTFTPSATATPTLTPFPEDHRVFVYASDREQWGRQILLRDLETGIERPLTDSFAGEQADAPSLSPDRQQVVYETAYQKSFLILGLVGRPDVVYPLTLEVIDFLEYNDWGPAWSPDGTHIAFHSDRNGNTDIFILDPETYEVIQVTTNPEADAYAAWSPDGTKLVYQCTINDGREICLIDATGDHVVQLTDNDRFDGLPDWSPDGTKIVFASTRDEEKEELYVMNIDGSDVQRLTHLPDSVETDPKWSPDGAYIIFESDAGGDFEICMIRADGSNLECLTDNQVNDRSADW
ncbi:MAG: PD40 domain-containing protein [Chloroflexi bacterium]|nr:PD40 domain-containing protein [Chloroflexota bacterium]